MVCCPEMAPKSAKKCENRRFAAHISIKKYHLGKMTSSPLSTNVPVVLYIGIIQLRLYDNLFFSSRKESKELMLKETAAPLNGFFILISERMKGKTEHR